MENIDFDKLKKGWLHSDDARRQGVPVQFTKKRNLVLYDEAYKQAQLGVLGKIIANHVYWLNRDNNYHYLGSFIIIEPCEPEPSQETQETYLSPFDGRTK